ncbi:MAG: tetratricopeptide repeat protein [Proteobacteria bacterium]|nr:tetratricopeptide repeat protein [Pseudomonadota bacterium]
MAISGWGLAGEGTRREGWRRPRTFGFGLVFVVLFSNGCASLGALVPGGVSEKRERQIPLRVERSEIPADYDVLVAEFAQLDGDFDLARVAFERAAEKDPDSAVLHERLSRLAWQLDDVDGAVREAELALGLDPGSLRVRFFLGRLYRLRRDFDGLDRVLRDQSGIPLNPDSTYVLYQVAYDQGDFNRAEELARRLLETEPEQLRGILALTTIFEQRSDFDSAETIVRSGLAAFPNHFLLFMRLAEIERNRGNRVGEIEVYYEVLEGHPGHYGILQRLGQAQIDGNDIDAAIETFSEVLERYPDDLISLRRLASLEFSVGRYEAATDRLERELARDGAKPELAFALGQIRKATGDYAGAVESYELIGRQDPNYFDARIQIAAIYESEKRYEEAIQEIEGLRVFRPDRPLVFHLASLKISSGDFEGGIAKLESLLDGSENDTEVHYQIGVQYGLHGDVDRAITLMRRVIEAEPDNANALNYIGYSWAERGENLEEAEMLIRRALKISPGDGYITDSLGWVYYKMAEILFEKSRTDEALRLLDRAHRQLIQAAELTGGDSVVSEHLGDVLLLRGDKRGALEHFDDAVGLEVRESEQPMLFQKRDRLRGDLGLPVPDGEAQ